VGKVTGSNPVSRTKDTNAKNKMKSYTKILLAVVGIVVGLVVVLAVRGTGASISPTSNTAATSTPATAEDAFGSAYPLYATNIVWDSKVPLSVPPHIGTNPTDTTIEGYEITSEPTATTTDISSITEPFRNYYDKTLLALGWSIDPTFQADGPGASVWGFRKGKEILIFSYAPTFLNNQPNQPVQCPCTITFSILGGLAQ
jgi:hypothetical protein